MNTGERICTAKYTKSPRLSRVVLAPNLQQGRQDPPNPEARKSADHQSEQRAKYEETRRGDLDKRIQGVPHLAVLKDLLARIVKRLIQQFENHPHRDSLMKGLNKTEKFNPFSEKSKELISSMGNTEYVKLCEMFSKTQCLGFTLYSGKRALVTAPAANACS